MQLYQNNYGEIVEWYNYIFKLCSHLCHQMPSRSFFIAGYQFPLCYRCTGLLLGTVIFLVIVYFHRLLRLNNAIIVIVPMLLDVGLKSIGWWDGTNLLRLITGIGFGIGIPALVLIAFQRLLKQ